MNVPRCAALFLGALAASGAGQQIQDETVFIDEIKKEFLDRVQKCEEGRDWKGLFEHYHHGLRRYSENVVVIAPDRWTSVREYLTTRLSRLPKEAYEYYRFENDGKARHAFEKAREAGSRHDLEKAVEDYFFSSQTGDVLDVLANLAFDEGRTEEALFHWNRLLRVYPDSSLPRHVIVARIANACRLSRNEAALADLRQYLKKSVVEGKVRVGDQEVELARYLDSIQIPPSAAVVASTPRLPYTPGPEEITRRRMLGVRNDIRRWVYDFAADRGEPAAQAPPENPQPGLAVRGAGFRVRRVQTLEGMSAPSFGEFPLFPAHARVRGKDYVIVTDGSRAVAVDPARVKGTSNTAGVYWKYPSAAILRFPPGTNPNANSAIGRPYLGIAVDGEFAYIPMASSLQVRPRDTNPQGMDTFEGATAMKCIYIPTGKVVWDTDLRPLLDEMKVVCKGFYDRNFSFSGTPLVQGDRLYVGICTSPVGEQESRVLCLDRKTGKPLWSTFLASLTGNQAAALQWGAGRLPAYQTMMAVQGGMLYVQSNLGIVGALSPVSGSIQWITRYKRSGRRFQNTGGVEPSFFRPANLPFVWRGKLYVLPQDRPELLAFECLTGKPEELPAPQTTGSEMEWRNMRHLVGLIDDSLVIQGSSSHVLRLTDFRAYGLASSLSMGTGRGLIKDDLIYLPLSANPGATVAGSLGIYDARLTNSIRPWKNLDQIPWKEPNEYGNLLVAGNYVVVATHKINVYTDVETLRNEFAHRLYQSPPHADSLLEFGDTMRENDRLEEAAQAYLDFIRAAEGDARYADRIRTVRIELHSIFIRRGDEVAAKGDAAKALEFYAFARSFAWDDKSQAEAIKRLAQTYENQKQWKDAVGQYQELIQKGRDLYHRESESVTKLWEHAARRIDAIVAGAPEAYAEVEKRAAEALKKVQQDSVEGLRDVMDRFPNSKTAREAFQRMRDTLFKQGKFEKLRALYNDFKDRFKLDLNFDSYRELLELLEKLGDTERLRYELGRFAERFGPEAIGVDGNEETVKDYVERRLLELAHRPRPAAGLQGPLNRIGEMEPLRLSPDTQGVSVGHRPLCPLGIAPPDFGPHLELFRRGSSVELWDLKANRRLWARAHPGAYLGVVFGDHESGVLVQLVKPGSPAEKAGLAKGDVLLSVDGTPVGAAGLSGKLAVLAAGSPVEVRCRREDKELKLNVELGGHPHDLRPAIVGASFTRDYALAVAWEDGVASIDLDSGEVQWVFRSIRERFHVRGFHATDGRLYVLETARHDRDADVFRMPAVPANTPFRPEDAHHRLYCLSDFTGELVWARAFGFDPKNPYQETQTTFFGPYLSDHVRFLQMGSRAGNREWVLWSIPASGSGQPMQRPLLGQVLAHAVDEAGGIFYYVADMMSDRRERMLYSISLDPSRKDFKAVEIPLHQAKYMPQNYAVCSLAVSRDYLALVVSPPQVDAEHRVWVWTTSDGKDRTLSLLPDRTLPVNRPAGLSLGEDGVLYVYNVPRQKTQTGNPARGYLTAFRLGVPAGTDPVAWDAMAPLLNHVSAPSFAPDAGNYAVLATTRASLPGDMGETSVAVVYDKRAEGYVRLRNSELFTPPDAAADPAPPALVWRGRIYVMARQGTLIFGD